MKNILQILYSGLGGTGSVFFSMVEAERQSNTNFTHQAIFYGIEPLVNDYKAKCKQFDVKYNYLKKLKGLDLKSQYKIYKLLKKAQPNAIILHSTQTIFGCKLYKLFNSKCRLIVVEHQANALKTKKLWYLSWLALKLADAVVYLTPNYKQEIEGKYPKATENKQIKVIPNGINLNVFYPNKNNQSVFTIGMASRLTDNKDHITLLNAIKRLQHKPYYEKLKLLIAGDGNQMKKLKQKVNELRLNDKVELLGMLPENELAHFYRQLNIYVHASFGETMSTSIMQAQATALPIIASNVKGINNIITNNVNGLLFESLNENDLSEKIDNLLTDNQLQQKLGSQSIKYAQKKLSAQNMWKAYKILL